MDMINNFIGLTLQLSVPIILGALCGTIAERGGIIILGVEGIMLIGAFAGQPVPMQPDQPWPGCFCPWFWAV